MKVSIQKKDIALRTPFVYYLDTLSALPYAEITITTPEGIVGKGEIPCALDINGETAEGSIRLAPFVEHLLSTFSIHKEEDIRIAMETLSLRLAFNEATRFGVEQALFDILAKRKRTTISKLLGSQEKKIKMQVTIPYLETEEEYKNKLDVVFQKDPTHIKIKVGANSKREAAVVKMIRSFSKTVHVSVDANQAFSTVGEALLFLDMIKDEKIDWIEQPLARSAPISDWLLLKKKSPIALMADESVHTQKDVEFFLQNKAVDYINLKLAKCGGILEARKIIATAKKYHVPVMLGSMLEGEIALKYNLAFGLSEDFIAYDFSRNYVLEDENTLVFIDEETLCLTEEILK